MHWHPLHERSFYTAHGLSPEDYIAFLSDNRQRAMMMLWGDSIMMAMKTSVTRTPIDEGSLARIKSEICETRLEILDNKMNQDVFQKVVNFNKMVCTVYGLTLYAAHHRSKILQRITVVR